MPLVIFSHGGRESGPNALKIRKLKSLAEDYGFDTLAVDYRACENVEKRLELLRSLIKEQNPQELILVGSSMGGYLSVVLSAEFPVAGLFLMCPALYRETEDYDIQEYSTLCKHIEMIHGWDDEIVPYENSVRFASKTRATLTLVEDDHALVHTSKIINNRFEAFLNAVQVP